MARCRVQRRGVHVRPVVGSVQQLLHEVCRQTKPMTLFCSLHQKYEPKQLPPLEEGMCRQITSRKARRKFRTRPNGFCGFHHCTPPISQSQRERKKEKKEKDSASKTTANSSTASETSATSKRVRLNKSARVCNGVDPGEREIVARIMK